MALFISFEGGEGSGKSTQASRLVESLEQSGIPAILFHEPGATRLGNHIRDLVKGRPWASRNDKRTRLETISPTAELFLFSASRAELVTKVLSKQVETPGLVIVADRYVDSTTAYQGYGRKMPLDLVQAVNELATGGLMPHKTFLLDCPPAEALKRVESLQAGMFDYQAPGRFGALRMDDESSRRFEDEPLSFHERVRKGYLDLARAEPQRWTVIDGMARPDEVATAIWSAVQDMPDFHELVSRRSASPESHKALMDADDRPTSA